LVFFKRVEAAQEADAGPQLQRVLDFRRQLEDTKKVLYRYIDDSEQSFQGSGQHLRAYAKGEPSRMTQPETFIVLPALALEEVNRAKEEARTPPRAEAESKKLRRYLKIEAMQLEGQKSSNSLSKAL